MDEREWLAQTFEENRGRLRSVAYRMLGSLSEADDAVQEAWLRLDRSDPTRIDNLSGWLTTVVARVCLDALRSRKSRAEESLDAHAAARTPPTRGTDDPEEETLLAESVGLALLVVLDRLGPAERIAFVLHDMFAIPFEDIASILGRSSDAARQLASRARRRVQSAPAGAAADLVEQREVVRAFLEALRAGDFEGLIALLDPDAVVRADAVAAGPGGAQEIRGARNWAAGALAFSRAARFVQPALVDGTVGAVWAPRGHLLRALRFTIRDGRIVEMDVIADPSRLQRLDLATLND